MEEEASASGFRLFGGGGGKLSVTTKGSCSSMDYVRKTVGEEDIPQKEMEGWQPFNTWREACVPQKEMEDWEPFTFRSVRPEEKKVEDIPMFGGGGVKRKFEESEDDTFVPEKGFYQPSSEDTWEAYQALITLVESQSKANLPGAVLCGVADEVLGVLKSKTISNPLEKKIEIEKIMNPIHDFVFNELVTVARQITDYYVIRPVKKSDDRVALFVPEEGFYQPKSEDTCTAYKLLLDTVRENLDSDQPQIVQCVVAHEILVILKDMGITNYVKKNKMESFLNYVSDDTFDLLVFIADLIKDFDEFKGTSSPGYTFGADAKGSSSSGWGADVNGSSSSGWNTLGSNAKGSSSSSDWGAGWDKFGSDVGKNEYIGQKPKWPRKVIEGFEFDAPAEALGTPLVLTYSSDEDEIEPKDLPEDDNASIPTADDVDVFDPIPDNVSIISDRVADISIDDVPDLVPDNVSVISDRVADISLNDLDENPASGDVVAGPASDNVDALSQIKLEYSSEEEIMYFDHDKARDDADKEDSDGWLKIDFDEDGI
ncbi:hypothetical protein AQUCO_00300593v1 [Aquilegia coerulea]|uniref:Pre-mRNA-splicing helicase BRR2-like plug domain-containing protein n=1 Tax=Aquilegia coerulea TaxID=218851 RepID=A0A2G5EZM2_AQUCA|nr:hypothetical protein AQUCO_00300593v1 [Aquilegia coerulea]